MASKDDEINKLLCESMLRHCIDTTSTAGVVNLDNIGLMVRQAIKDETSLAKKENDQIAKAKRVKTQRRKRKEKNIEKLKSKPKTRVTRSMLPEIKEKFRLTQQERYFLNTNYQLNRCSSCNKLKDLECFYIVRATEIPHKSKYSTMCVACTNFVYNNQPEEAQFRRLLQVTKINAKERDIEFDLTVDDIQQLYKIQNGRCNYSGRKIQLFTRRDRERKNERNKACVRAYQNVNKASIDRIDPNKGYLRDNIHLVALHVNLAKLDLLEEDFIEMCENIVKIAHARKAPTLPPLVDPGQSSVLSELSSSPFQLPSPLECSPLGDEKEPHNNT